MDAEYDREGSTLVPDLRFLDRAARKACSTPAPWKWSFCENGRLRMRGRADARAGCATEG